MKTIDFCCGAGGATAGVRAAHGDVVAALDIDPMSLSAYVENHAGRDILADLTDYDFTTLPHHDAGVWCPPCGAGSWVEGRTPYEAATGLMASVLRYARDCRPRFLLFENVPALTGWKGHHAWRCELEHLGYWVTDGVAQAADFVPQERSRYLLLAARGLRPPRMPAARLRSPITARKIINVNPDRGSWRFVADASSVVRRRIVRARERFGDAFLLAASSMCGAPNVDHFGRSLDRPMAAVIPGRAWYVVSGAFIRLVELPELAVAQGFSAKYRFTGTHDEQLGQVGRAFSVGMARAAFEALVS